MAATQPLETDSLLGHQSNSIIHVSVSNQQQQHKKKTHPLHSLLHHLNTPLTTRHGDLILLYCYIITGLLDSAAVSIWGSFVSMQTGNTIYLGMGLASAIAGGNSDSGGGDSGKRWIKAGISIGSFCVGSFFFSAFHHRLSFSSSSSSTSSSPRKRWVLMCSFVVQMVCIACAATIVTFSVPKQEKQQQQQKQFSKDDSQLTWHVIVPLSLLAFQSSGQAVLSRVMKCSGLTSIVLTSVYCELFSNYESLFGVFGPAEQRRRVGAVVCFLLGTILGATWARSWVGLMGALWMAIGMKAVLVLVWLFWAGEDEDDHGEVEV